MEQLERPISLSEAARQLGVHLQRLMDARDRGELPVYKIDKKWHRVYPSDVRAWIESKRVNGAEQ